MEVFFFESIEKLLHESNYEREVHSPGAVPKNAILIKIQELPVRLIPS